MASMTASRDATSTSIERRAREIGRVLFAKVGGGPKPWERGWWDDRLMDLTMGDPGSRSSSSGSSTPCPRSTTPAAVRRHLARIPGRGRRSGPLVAPAGRRAGPGGDARGSGRWRGLARFAATHMAHRFIAGSTPDEALETVLGPAAAADRLHRRPPGRGGHQRARGRRLPADLPRAAPRAGRAPWPPSPRSPDRPRSPRADPSRQPLAEADEPDAPVRRPPRRDDRRRVASTGSGRSCGRPARPGAFVHVDMEQYAHKDLTYAIFRVGPLRARVPRLGRRRDRHPGLSARGRGRPASARELGQRAGHADHGPAGQGGVLGLRGRCTPASSAGRSRSTSRSGRPTPATSVAPGS